jgi:hypothetical protein
LGYEATTIPIRRIGLALENLRFTHVETCWNHRPSSTPKYRSRLSVAVKVVVLHVRTVGHETSGFICDYQML